jgi:hypothetical protein
VWGKVLRAVGGGPQVKKESKSAFILHVHVPGPACVGFRLKGGGNKLFLVIVEEG